MEGTVLFPTLSSSPEWRSSSPVILDCSKLTMTTSNSLTKKMIFVALPCGTSSLTVGNLREACFALGGGERWDCPLRARLQGLSPSGPSQSFCPAARGPSALLTETGSSTSSYPCLLCAEIAAGNTRSLLFFEAGFLLLGPSARG